MAEAGVDITPQTSKTIDDGIYGQQQVIITLCGDAHERCPVVPPTALVRRHWDLPDPAKATGTEEEILAQFRTVRDDIRARIVALLTELEG
jgi:arsenate reductase